MNSSRKMNIAQITPYFYPAVGGIEKATLETSKRLVKKGHRVTVYTSKSKFHEFNTLKDEENIEGIRIRRFPEYFNTMSTWFPKIDSDEDILHFRNYCINPHTYLIGKFYKKKPMVLTVHGGYSRYEGAFPFRFSLYGIGKWLWQFYFGSRYLNKLTKIFALHGWEKGNLISKGVRKEIIEVLPNGIEDAAFAKYKPSKFDKPYILSLCRISKVKSLDHVIRVLPDIPNVYYVIAGSDVGEGELDNLKQLAKDLKVSNRVKFVGNIAGSEKYEYIAGASLVVVPSQWEMLSHTILESMAQAKLVIASDSYGNPHILDDKKTGYIYKYGDMGTLKNILIDSLANPNKAVSLGKAAKDKLWKDYRWDSVVDKLEGFYKGLLK